MGFPQVFFGIPQPGAHMSEASKTLFGSYQLISVFTSALYTPYHSVNCVLWTVCLYKFYLGSSGYWGQKSFFISKKARTGFSPKNRLFIGHFVLVPSHAPRSMIPLYFITSSKVSSVIAFNRSMSSPLQVQYGDVRGLRPRWAWAYMAGFVPCFFTNLQTLGDIFRNV